MLTYKHFSTGPSPCIIIPGGKCVDKSVVALYIDAPPGAVRLYYTYAPRHRLFSKSSKSMWLQHDCGVLPEQFADHLFGGVTAVKVVNQSPEPVVIKIKPFIKIAKKHG